jgi:hypothetical protein
MARPLAKLLVAVVVGCVPACLWACVLCPVKREPLQQEIGRSRVVFFGPIIGAKLHANGVDGESELRIEAILKDDPAMKDKKVFRVGRYVPPNPQLRYLAFVDQFGTDLDIIRSIPFSTDRVVAYLRGLPIVGPDGDRTARLRYAFDYLSDPEAEIAADAFNEWAASSNRDVAKVAVTLPPEKIRSLLASPKTPVHALSLYGYLLGACGNAGDAAVLKRWILAPDERMANALDGLLAGLIALEPDEGWRLARAIIADKERSFVQRHSVLRMLRFLHDSYADQPAQRKLVFATMGWMARQDDLLDLAADQLGTWKCWDFTNELLAAYGTPAAAAPITKRALLRYALRCPLPVAKKFVQERRATDGAMIQELEEELQFDAADPAKLR